MPATRARSLGLIAVALLSFGGVARADDRASAQQLFEQARALVEAGKLAEACPKFEAAAQLSPTPGVRLNLADCWAKIGRTASAWAKYNEALGVAERSGDAAAADAAKRGRAAITPTLSYLTIAVPKESEAPGLRVSFDAEALPSAALGTALPVDPGEHVVAATAPSRQSWSQRIIVRPGVDNPSVVVPALAAQVAIPSRSPAPVAAPPQVTLPEPAPLGHTQRILAWVAGGVGLAGIGVGTAFGIDAKFKKDDYQGVLGGANACPTESCSETSKSAYNAALASTIGFVAGGALLAAGGLLWFTAPSAPSGASARLSWACLGGPRSQGLSVTGTW